jgi:anaerobic magnesium-protoporphyrin IX monomethyl ester cyclase
MEKKKIYLILPPSHNTRTPEECLGLEYLVSAANFAGFDAYYIDARLEKFSKSDLLEKILKENPFIIGLAPALDSKDHTIDIILELRKKHYTGQIVLGGVFASFVAESLLKEIGHLISGIFIGEADDNFVIFLKNEKIDVIQNVAYLSSDKKIIFTPRKKQTKDLDTLLFPDRSKFQLFRKTKTPLHIMGSRGCRGNCSFCSIACFQKFSSSKRWRGRSPNNIISELKHLSSLGEDMVKFIDDNFFSDRIKSIRENEIAELIIRNKIPIKFRISLRVDDVNNAIIKKLKAAGLFGVSLGVESFVQRKLDFYEKKTSVFQNLKAIKILHDNNIFVQIGHIMFDPFVTKDEIEKEIFFLEQTKHAVTEGLWSTLIAARGTRITEYIIKKLGITGKNTLNYYYDIQNRWGDEFYKVVMAWEKNVRKLYDKIINPISAPKNIEFQFYSDFHELYLEFKNIEFQIIKKFLVLSNDNIPYFQDLINTEIMRVQPLLLEINRKNDSLYKNAGLIAN